MAQAVVRKVCHVFRQSSLLAKKVTLLGDLRPSQTAWLSFESAPNMASIFRKQTADLSPSRPGAVARETTYISLFQFAAV